VYFIHGASKPKKSAAGKCRNSRRFNPTTGLVVCDPEVIETSQRKKNKGWREEYSR
jgi:hypothetical protein